MRVPTRQSLNLTGGTSPRGNVLVPACGVIFPTKVILSTRIKVLALSSSRARTSATCHDILAETSTSRLLPPTHLSGMRTPVNCPSRRSMRARLLPRIASRASRPPRGNTRTALLVVSLMSLRCRATTIRVSSRCMRTDISSSTLPSASYPLSRLCFVTLCDRLVNPYVQPILHIRRPGSDLEETHRFPDDDPFFSEVSNLIDIVEDIEEDPDSATILSSYEGACPSTCCKWHAGWLKIAVVDIRRVQDL
jgi:hypothetical protein